MAKRIPGRPEIAIGYLRVSTEDQNLGIEAQRAAIVAWAMRNQVAIVAWHVDQGVSGSATLEERPGLMAALVSVREHDAGAILVAKRDRIARDVVVAVTVERAAASAGAQLVSVDGTGNGDSPADEFMRTIIYGAAQYERALIRARTKAALAAKKAQGRCAGEVPFGYRKLESGMLEENEEEQRIIRRVRELRALGVSLRAVAAKLAAEKLQSRAGKPLALTQVARIAA